MASRRPVFFNNPTEPRQTSPRQPFNPSPVLAFHQSLPGYKPTPLISLPGVASEIGVKAVHIKIEADRFGLPSFKILGASWGTVRALIPRLGLPFESSIEDVREAVKKEGSVTLFAATDGNHGRAVAWMGKILGANVEIFVPNDLLGQIGTIIGKEGAKVTGVDGSYDDSVKVAFDEGKKRNGVVVQDTVAAEGYDEIPQWIVEGYSTMMGEIDGQLGDQKADLVITPAGVGSLAQAVVSHYKVEGRSTKVMIVEPDTSACVYHNLRDGKVQSIETTATIMNGLNCGTVSTAAWPILKDGVDASVTVSDYETHEGILYLSTQDISVGPCGAASLAALHRLSSSDKATLGLDQTSTVVLLATEGQRAYKTPRSVSISDTIELTQTLVQINSANPDGGTVTAGPGEREVAEYIAAWFQHRDIETHWIEPTPGRPSVVGVVRGSGGGKSMMLNGHIDTVTLAGYEGDALSGEIKDGKLYGRGAADMKSGLAAALVATAKAKELGGLRGDVIFAGVADEEALSLGTEQLLAAGWRADGAVISEPSDLEMVTAHKGFSWLEVDIYGVAAHGSMPKLGVDAIAKAGYFLVELDKLATQLDNEPAHSSTGRSSVHASIIKGGEEPASYPARCTITIEYRTIKGETPDSVQDQVKDILERLAKDVKDFSYDIRTTFSRSPFEISADHAFVSLVQRHIEVVTERKIQPVAGSYWTDCALLADEGIPVLLFGPVGHGLHGKEEWADVDSIRKTTDTLISVIKEFCG